MLLIPKGGGGGESTFGTLAHSQTNINIEAKYYHLNFVRQSLQNRNSTNSNKLLLPPDATVNPKFQAFFCWFLSEKKANLPTFTTPLKKSVEIVAHCDVLIKNKIK